VVSAIQRSESVSAGSSVRMYWKSRIDRSRRAFRSARHLDSSRSASSHSCAADARVAAAQIRNSRPERRTATAIPGTPGVSAAEA